MKSCKVRVKKVVKKIKKWESIFAVPFPFLATTFFLFLYSPLYNTMTTIPDTTTAVVLHGIDDIRLVT